MKLLRQILPAFLVLISISSFADTYYVAPGGSDSNPGDGAHPWRTIRHAMSMITPEKPLRHELRIAEGYYEEDFEFKDYVNVYGGFHAGDWAHNIEWFPSFIKRADGTPFTVPNNVILDGLVFYSGLKCLSSSPNIAHCRILMSKTHGIDCFYSSPYILDCNIKQCLEDGIHLEMNSSPTIENTVSAMNGGDGISAGAKCNPTMNHVTVAHNFFAGIRAEEGADPYIDNSIIWENGDDLVNCHVWHSCVSDGDDNPGNTTEDPLFFGWSGFNEYQPLYVSPYGSDTGNGSAQSPMKYFHQAFATYRYWLSISSPHIDEGSDQKDLGAFPEPSEYLPWFGNTAQILASPGSYQESGIIVTVPVTITGYVGYTASIDLQGGTGFIWKGKGGISYLELKNGNYAIHQLDGDLRVKGCTISGFSQHGILVERGTFSLEGASIRNCALDGLHLQNVSPEIRDCLFEENGQNGIYCDVKSSPRISGSEFIRNPVGLSFTDSTSPSIRDCAFLGNYAYGIFCSVETDAFIHMSRFHDNYIGIQLNNWSSAKITSCLFYDNRSDAIKLGNSTSAFAANNTICRNNIGVGVYDQATADILNCIIRENTQSDLKNCTAGYSNVSGGAPGKGNFDLDPLFQDPAASDFHLKPGSPCIDAGFHRDISFRDIDGDPRPMGLSVDVGADEAPDWWGFSFERDAQDWRTISVPNYFTPPLFEAREGCLTLTSHDERTFGFWDSPPGALPIEEEFLYRLRVRVRGTVPDTSRSPGLRVRLSTRDSQWIQEMDVFSMGQGPASPPLSGRDYDLYFIPPKRTPAIPLEKNDLTISCDIVSLDDRDETSATLFIENILIERMNRNLLPGAKRDTLYEFRSGPEGWNTGDATPYYTPPYFDSKNSVLTMESKNNWNCYGFWETLVSNLELTKDRFYRVDFTIRTDAPPELVPSVRFRIFSEDHAVTQLWMFNSTSDASVTLTRNDKVYSFYFVPMEEYTVGDLRGLRLACDLVNFNDKDAPKAIIGIERVEIYSSAIPSFP